MCMCAYTHTHFITALVCQLVHRSPEHRRQDHTVTNQRQRWLERRLHFHSSLLLDQLNSLWNHCLLCICQIQVITHQHATTFKQFTFPLHHFSNCLFCTYPFIYLFSQKIILQQDGSFSCYLPVHIGKKHSVVCLILADNRLDQGASSERRERWCLDPQGIARLQESWKGIVHETQQIENPTWNEKAVV